MSAIKTTWEQARERCQEFGHNWTWCGTPKVTDELIEHQQLCQRCGLLYVFVWSRITGQLLRLYNHDTGEEV